MKKSKLTKVRVRQYFNGYPRLNTMYFTTDGSGFTDPEQAIAFAKAKGYAAPIMVERDSLNNEGEELIGKTIETNTSGSSEPSEEDKTKLRAFELSEDCDWNELQKLGRAFDISAKTKAEHIEALTPIKAALGEEE